MADQKKWIVAIQADEDSETRTDYLVSMTEAQATRLDNELRDFYESGGLYWWAVYEPKGATYRQLLRMATEGKETSAKDWEPEG